MRTFERRTRREYLRESQHAFYLLSVIDSGPDAAAMGACRAAPRRGLVLILRSPPLGRASDGLGIRQYTTGAESETVQKHRYLSFVCRTFNGRARSQRRSSLASRCSAQDVRATALSLQYRSPHRAQRLRPSQREARTRHRHEQALREQGPPSTPVSQRPHMTSLGPLETVPRRQ